jgi:hypothetical protein
VDKQDGKAICRYADAYFVFQGLSTAVGIGIA